MVKYSTLYKVETSLIFAICKVESNFDRMALSSKGAVGIMQIMPETAKYILNIIGDIANYSDITESLYNADININIGVYYMKYLLEKYGFDEVTSLAAYNAGEGNVDRWIREKYANLDRFENKLNIEDIKYMETKKYVQKVLKSRYYYKKLYNLE